MKNIHKGWFILTLITCCVLASLGFGRFSFGAILPFMKTGLHLDYKETGYLASSIFLGYFIAVIVAGYFVIRFKAKKVIVFSLFFIALGMVLTANSSNFYITFLGCLIIGLGTGGAYVPSLGLLGHWFASKSRGMALGIAMGGSGIGIVFSGLTMPMLIQQTGDNGWRIGWYLLASLIILITLLNVLFLKNRPEDLNLKPIVKGQEALLIKEQPGASEETTIYQNKTIWFLGFIYFTWGMSYLVFSTFLVDYLIVDVGFTNEAAGTFFAIAGITSIISGFIWGSLSDRVGRMFTLMIVFFSQSFLLLSLSFSENSVLLFLITAVYGVTLWGVPTIINATVIEYIHPKYITIAMGFVTVFFSTGQLVSPIITGFLIEYANSYFSAFLFSSVSALFGGLGCIKLLLNKRKKAEQSSVEIHILNVKDS
ncbi:MAG TPA: YbfB/YjiJ family MFS transporter [Bacillus bacterium]|nr:YbfB/YjiJ family MFS transporter [Bacillus sp. (in: firmicutes)]